ncbi:MAG: hypothetical protein ACM3XO_28995 [Bacteroidota bacterium]
MTKFKNPILFLERMRKKGSGNIPGRQNAGGSMVTQANDNPPAHRLNEAESENQVVEKTSASGIRRILNGPVVTFEGTYQGQPIRVRIIAGPIRNQDRGRE